jgi:SNF2 family DNA or RNA helicase
MFSLQIDGSTQYLGITIPPSEHPLRTAALDLLKASGFQLDALSRVWRLHDQHRVLAFLAAHGQMLHARFNAQFTAGFCQRTAKVAVARLVSSAKPLTGGRFEFTAAIEAPGVSERELHLALAKNLPYVESGGGKIILLPPEVLQAATALANAIEGRPAFATPAARFAKIVPANALANIDNTIQDLSVSVPVKFAPPKEWRARSEALRNLSALREAPVEPALNDRLRFYQKIGTAWLYHLHTNGLGGVLADEMGLGKTVEALAFITALQAAAPEGTGISALVVCPAALVENWCREAARFAPGLPFFRHHGQDRTREPEGLPASGAIITSYGTLARDTAVLGSREWTVIIADEAQHIKNHASQNAQSLRSLRAAGRFALTGTPVENSVDDLRSLFAFLMPGHIPSPPSSANREERQWHDKRALAQAAPYVLRREKRVVAPELPEKIEQTVFVELEGAQERLYTEWRDSCRREIFELEMSGATEGRVRILALNHLLRLRQICAEPRLLAPTLTAADSAKSRALREVLDEAIDGGHRLLVFSQFVEVLHHLRDDLRADGIPLCYMDGSTRDRQAECDRFNGNEDIPVFLISLKAGGTGLNLTGADTVVHFDPWWNPAVEAQATDRAHRIGQVRVVTSLKLIAAGTVEERVLDLQREKAALLRELFEGGAAAATRIGLADLKALVE